MKNCKDCKHARWKRTANWILHPSGEGRCEYPLKEPELPAAFYYARYKVYGGNISRKQTFECDCLHWERTAKTVVAR